MFFWPIGPTILPCGFIPGIEIIKYSLRRSLRRPLVSYRVEQPYSGTQTPLVVFLASRVSCLDALPQYNLAPHRWICVQRKRSTCIGLLYCCIFVFGLYYLIFVMLEHYKSNSYSSSDWLHYWGFVLGILHAFISLFCLLHLNAVFTRWFEWSGFTVVDDTCSMSPVIPVYHKQSVFTQPLAEPHLNVCIHNFYVLLLCNYRCFSACPSREHAHGEHWIFLRINWKLVK